ncbi:HEPN domain-containing protein [Methanocalculus taiwanensis]|uniref:HEPN domain-containing protein n=1 Tax=Methanocalculus taiwanensis TaxID=106207 RepID=A0ABD4THB8_9EURY|nr:HEPN domain-containing protein [Methanocalculus taiwanensis]MCQ1538348.1 HEPN domain-containing protein [Methanocalculus taiwanensis]
MQFQWSHYIEVAKYLFESAIDQKIPQEAGYRSSISRAYYAAFCHAKYYAKDNFSFSPADNDDDHRELREFLKQNGRNEIARHLTSLRLWRNQSDYDDPAYDVNPQKVKSALDLAEKVVILLK